MVFGARRLALLLAVTIAIATTLFLFLVQKTEALALLGAAVVSFSISYGLIFAVLKRVIVREIDEIFRMLAKLQKKELYGNPEERPGMRESLKKINEEIFSFATQKQKEIDDLRKLEAFRKEFIADVSHELKTPIFAAQGFVHTLLDGAVNDRNVRTKFLRKAARSLDGLDALVQDLLTLSQIETGDIKMRFEHIDLYQLCQEVVDLAEVKAEKKKVKLELGKSNQNILVHADWQRITQVVTNLVSNAINYTAEDGEVVIRFHVGKKNVTTFVSDTGVGIPAEHLARIFERFYRVDKSRSRERGGTGLGLAIVKHILEGHGSRAEVESTEGKGSVFSFKLPRSRPDDEEED